jgi:hypothetical protein
MSDGSESPPTTQSVDLETGVFHLVIALCHRYEAEGVPRGEAKERAARYLERLINGLRIKETHSEGERSDD